MCVCYVSCRDDDDDDEFNEIRPSNIPILIMDVDEISGELHPFQIQVVYFQRIKDGPIPRPIHQQ